jgi:mRNA-degrading endonuclease toxin of MazEF toxin-antitoxin module
MTICDRFEVVVVSFPFIDTEERKPRPAVVLSHRAFNAGHGASVLAMITTAARSQWPSDVALTDLSAAGLRHRSFVRLKLFSLDNVLIARRIGSLAIADRGKVEQAVGLCLGPLRRP